MSETFNETRDALERLNDSPGWKLFVAHVADAWGPKAYAQKLKAAVSHARMVGKDAAQAVELVDAANDAIGEAMNWPAQEAARLRRLHEDKKEADVLTLPRGGYR